jgi:hypothetical protein
MFYWESDNKKQKYTIACMGTRRYPKVVGPERFKYIFEKYRRGLGLTYLENKNLPDSNEQLVDEEYCEPDKPIGSTNKCVSIKYGSQEEPAQWSNHYMCPKIWCIRDKIPLHPRDLIDGENPEAGCDRFESQGDITLEELKETFKSYKEYQKAEYIIWRICKKCNQDILKHNIKCPECKGAPLEPTNTNMIPTKTTSLYVVEKDTNYIYPGFVSGDKHPSKIPAVCCFNNPNTRLSEKFSISNYKTNYNTLAYIQTFGKELQPGRFGQLPIAFSGFMDLDIDYFNATSIRCDHTSKNYYYRFGILSSPSENSLNILSFYLLHNDMSVGVDKDSLAAMTDKLLYDIIRKMTSSVLMRYPILEYAFRSSGVSSLQNYIEFLVSDDPKPDFTVLQILNQSMEWLEDKERLGVDPSIIQTGLNIFIFSVNDDGKMVIELPRGFVQPYELGKRAKSVLLFRNKNINNMLEPIVFSKSGCDRAGGDNTKRANKFFEYDHPLIKKIMAILEKLDKDRSPISLFNNRDNKYLELTDFHDRTIDWLMMEHRVNLEKLGYKIERIVVDSSNLVVGVITNNTFVPTYPANYTSSLDVFSKIKYLDMLESELGNYLRVSESILGLIKYKRDEFSYLEPIKVVKSNIENDSYYTGYYLSCGVIVPFEPTKNISNIYLPSIQIDFRAIERSIVDYKENYTYTKRLRLETLKKMSITESDYEYVIEDGKLKGIIISLIDLNIFNTFIPMAEIEWDGRMPENLYSGPMPKYNLEQTIENYNKLYTGIRERLPCRVIGVVMNDLTKIVERIQLETGDFIDVIPNTPIYKRFKNSKYRYLLHMIQDIELDDIFAEEQYNYETFHTDDRIDYIMSMDYNKYSYDRFRFEVARLLSLSDVDSAKMGGRIVPKREITELLSNNRIGLQEKRQLLSKMIVSLVHNNIIYTKVDIKSVGKSQKFVEQSCSVHRLKNQCSADPFCNWVEETQGQSLAEFKEANIQKVKNILSTLEKNRESITKYINNMRKYLEYNGRQWSDSDMDMNINNKLEIDYLRKGNCRLVLLDDENLDFIRSKYIRKLVDEILRNPIRRKEIMENSIRIVETRLSYNVYPNEVFYTEKDIKLNTAELRTLYQRNRRSKLRVLNHFTRNSSNYYNVVEPVENNQYIEQKLRDNSYTLYLNSGLIDFKITGLERMVVSDVHQTQNVVILDDNRAILDIIRKNTPLDSWRVNNVGKNIRFSVVEKE